MKNNKNAKLAIVSALGASILATIGVTVYLFIVTPMTEKRHLLSEQISKIELQLDSVLSNARQCSHARLISAIGGFDLNSERHKKAIRECASLVDFSTWVLGLVVEPELSTILPALDKLKNDVDEFSTGVVVEERTGAEWSGHMDELIKKDVRDVRQKLYNIKSN